MTSLDLTDQTLLKQTTKTSLSGSSRGPDCGSEERGLHPPAGEQSPETGMVIWWWGCWCDVCLYSWWSWPQTAVWMATLWTREAWWPRPRLTSWWWRDTDITSMVEVSTESHYEVVGRSVGIFQCWLNWLNWRKFPQTDRPVTTCMIGNISTIIRNWWLTRLHALHLWISSQNIWEGRSLLWQIVKILTWTHFCIYRINKSGLQTHWLGDTVIALLV